MYTGLISFSQLEKSYMKPSKNVEHTELFAWVIRRDFSWQSLLLLSYFLIEAIYI